IGGNVVNGIQGQPVTAPTISDIGAALVFEGNRWDLGRFAPEGRYVEYAPDESGYALVAAGRFGFEFDGNKLVVKELSYSGGPTGSCSPNSPSGPSCSSSRLRWDWTEFQASAPARWKSKSAGTRSEGDEAMTTALDTPILDGAIRSVNFFNGRLLTAKDLWR